MALTFNAIQRMASFERGQAFPLDKWSYFESYELAVAAAQTAEIAGTDAAKNVVYYIGQTLVVNEGSEAALYIIQPDKTLKKVAAKTDIESLQTDVSTAKTDIESLQTDVSTAKTDIESLQTDVSTAKTDVSTAKTDIESLQTDVSTLQGYFTNGIANKATSDKNGNDITITYVKLDGSLIENQLVIASSDNKIKTGYAILDNLSAEGVSGIPTSDAVKNAISTATSSIDMSSKLDKLPGYTGESTESERAYVVYPNGTQGYIAIRNGYSINGIPKYVQGKIQSGTAEKEYDVINLRYLNGAIEDIKGWAKDYVAQYVSQYVEGASGGE